MKAGFIILVAGSMVLLSVVCANCARRQSVRIEPERQLGTHDPSPYADLLAAAVDEGLVDYRVLADRHADDLDQYLDALARFGPDSTPDLFPRRADRLAYFINAYNAIMLRKWLDAGAGDGSPIRTVNRLWFVVEQWQIDGRWISLDSLEQRIIRSRFEEPRVHLALVCGARGCPPLLDVPLEADRLDEQFDSLARRWLREPDGLSIQPDGTVLLSKIFQWYRSDFDSMGGLEAVLDRYVDAEHPHHAQVIAAARDGRLRFMDYDWTINAVPAGGSP